MKRLAIEPQYQYEVWVSDDGDFMWCRMVVDGRYEWWAMVGEKLYSPERIKLEQERESTLSVIQ